MKRKYKSEIAMVLHQNAADMYRVGALTDEEMRDWDRRCLVQKPAAAERAEQPAALPACAARG